MKFIAVDVETANADCASICQIGVALFEDGEVRETREWLVDPEGSFDPMNVSIHGITEADVNGEATFPDVFPELGTLLSERLVVHHTHFDRTALTRAARRYGLTPVDAVWLDSAKVVRRTWSEYSRRGYGLGNVTAALGIAFDHHDALEDAIACGRVLVRAIERSGLSVEEWLVRARQPIRVGEDDFERVEPVHHRSDES